MRRYLRALALSLSVSLVLPALPVQAQMSFEGLGGSKKKKKKKPKTDRERGTTETETSAPLPEGGLDLSKPEGESSPAKPAETKGIAPPPAPGSGPKAPAPGMSFDAVELSGKTVERQRLDVALSQFKAEQYEQAALAAHDLMQEPKMAALYLEANYLLAKALYRMGMYHASLGEFSKILARGPNGNRYFKTSLEWLFFISHKTVNETVILDEIAKYSNYEFPEKFRNEFRYLLARYQLLRGRALDQVEQKAEADKSFEEVRKLVTQVPRKDANYARAKYLEGLAYFRGEQYERALESFKTVVRLTRRPPGPVTAEAKQAQSIREAAFMQLARIHYGARQNRNAIYYFNKVERGNTQWLESLFESSWASYRIGQYEQALGNLITLSSPFFRDEYFPEAHILKAVIYYENCRYRESTAILEEFERIYVPVQQQLQVLVDRKMDSSEYYNVLAEVQKKNKDGLEKDATELILERVLKLALTDKDLKKTNDSILELESEIDGFGSRTDTFKFSNLSKSLLDGLKSQRESLINKAGIMAKGKLEFELGQLKQFLANALRIRFETTSKEKEFLEQQLAEGGATDIVRRYKYSVAVSDDQLYWPYEGEYWRDELGTYQYTLTKGCKDANVSTASAGARP